MQITVLQGKLNDIYNWSVKWQLSISCTKCNILCVGTHVNNIPIMQLNRSLLEVLDEVKDLGIIVDSDLSFKSHINNFVARAFIKSKLITRCFVSRNISTLMRAFTVYVRPLVEYASTVWSPYQVGLIKKAESVQRKFTKWLPGFRNIY
jgi:hypothetical protein